MRFWLAENSVHPNPRFFEPRPYRDQGVGKALMTATLQKAKTKGLTRIELTVRENNIRAIALYEKLGFEKEGVHKNGVCIDGKYENHIFMALLFS